MTLHVDQILDVMVKAGFPLQVAVTMTAIALRESGGMPNAFNGNEATGDRSYGLLQINMRDKNVAALMHKNGIALKEENELVDPAINAKAGFLLWGGHNSNLRIVWYIDRPVYRERYESHLPAAQAAALARQV